MQKAVIDASALVALLRGEPGARLVKEHLDASILSAVNLYETATVLVRYGLSWKDVKQDIESLVTKVLPYSMEHAHHAIKIHQQTRDYGLSLGDCACLAVAQYENAIALTADKIWKNVKIDVPIQVIR